MCQFEISYLHPLSSVADGGDVVGEYLAVLTGVLGQIFPGLTDAGVVTEVHPSLGSPAAVHGVDDPALLAVPRLLLISQAGHGAAGLAAPGPPL